MSSKASLSIFVDGRTFGASFAVSHRISNAPYGLNRLHGHTYELAAELKGKIASSNSMVFPFEELMNIMKSICADLNNKVLLASGGGNVLKEDSTAIEYVSGDGKRYFIPKGDARILPLEEVTAEALVGWIAKEIDLKLREYREYYANIQAITVTLFEGRERGCKATIQLT